MLSVESFASRVLGLKSDMDDTIKIKLSIENIIMNIPSAIAVILVSELGYLCPRVYIITEVLRFYIFSMR